MELKALEWILALEGAAKGAGGVKETTGQGAPCCALVEKGVIGLGGLLQP